MWHACPAKWRAVQQWDPPRMFRSKVLGQRPSAVPWDDMGWGNPGEDGDATRVDGVTSTEGGFSSLTLDVSSSLGQVDISGQA